MGDFQTFINEIIESRRVKITEDKASLEKGIKYKEADLNYYIKGLQADRFRLIEYDKRLEALVDTAAKLTICVKNIAVMKYVNSVTYDVDDKSLLIHTSGEMKAYTQGNDEIILGPLVIEIFINKNEVAVFCDEDNGGGYGYWTDHDPHPHVSGSSGKPCLGDVESPIALAFSSYDYDIVAMLMLEFLQSVNTNDPAGEKYKGWSHTNSDGEFFEARDTNVKICQICNDEVNEDDYYNCDDCGICVCYNCSKYIDERDASICLNCFEDSYEQCETCNSIVTSDDIYHCEHCSNSICEDCIEGADENFVCNKCLEEYYSVCGECGKTINNDDIVKCEECEKTLCIDCITDGMCNECIKEDYSNCEICNKLTDNANVLRCQECGKWVCEDCMTDGVCNKCIEDREDILEDIQEEEDADNDCEGECVGNCLACMTQRSNELLDRVNEALREELVSELNNIHNEYMEDLVHREPIVSEEQPIIGDDIYICNGCGKNMNQGEATTYYTSVTGSNNEAIVRGEYYCVDCIEGGKINE